MQLVYVKKFIIIEIIAKIYLLCLKCHLINPLHANNEYIHHWQQREGYKKVTWQHSIVQKINPGN